MMATLVRSATAYFVVLGFLLWPWIAVAPAAVPGPRNVYDALYFVWSMAWVSHALVHDPTRLLDARINYPAPAQLTGSEHLLTSQLVFGPVFWLTENPVLAANAVVLLSYPLGAIAMERLLKQLGCGSVAAWVGGLAFALGPLRVPGWIQAVQYPNLFLPLVALALVGLRTTPTTPRVAWLAVVFAAGVFASYYLAVLISVVAAAWIGLELLRPLPGRLRFLMLAGCACAIGLALLAAISLPYFERAPAPRHPSTVASPRDFPLVSWLILSGEGRATLALVGLGIASLAFGGMRPVAARGLLFTALGLALVIWLPALLAVPGFGPLAFFRQSRRSLVLMGFGTALLAAGGLEALRRRFGARMATVVALAAGVGLVVERGGVLRDIRPYPVPALEHAAVYDLVGRAARSLGEGALLELPLARVVGAPPVVTSLEPESMIGSTRHWLPLVGGFSGYAPPHRLLLLATIDRFPADDALSDIVDMTRLRWLLLRPASDWANPGARAGLLGLGGVRPALVKDGWALARVDREPRHATWFNAIAAGIGPGQTMLGTPLGFLPAEAAVAEISLDGAPPRVVVGRALDLPIRVRNAGQGAWPVSVQPVHPPRGWLRQLRRRPSRTHTVELVSRWRGDPTGPPSQRFRFPRDVMPGETLTMRPRIGTPSRPGSYVLHLRVRQVLGASFVEPASRPLRLPLEVVAP